MLITSIYNIVDQIYLSRLIGPEANASTTVAFPIVITMLSLSLLLVLDVVFIFPLALVKIILNKLKNTYRTAFLSLSIISILLTFTSILFLDKLIVLFGAVPEIFTQSYNYTLFILIGSWLYFTGFFDKS